MYQSSPLQMNVMTFNTGGFGWGRDHSRHPDFEKVKDFITAMIYDHSTDFIGLQEAYDVQEHHRMFASSRVGAVTYSNSHHSRHESLYIVHDANKWRAQNQTRKYDIQSRHGGEKRPIFGCLFTQKFEPGHTVLVINAWLPHASYDDLRESVEKAVGNVYEEAVSALGAHPRGTIMTGDFNEFFSRRSGQGCVPIPLFTHRFGKVGDLQHARTEHVPTLGDRTTDYVLFSSFSPLAARLGSRVPHHSVGSDHKPVLCTFNL